MMGTSQTKRCLMTLLIQQKEVCNFSMNVVTILTCITRDSPVHHQELYGDEQILSFYDNCGLLPSFLHHPIQ